MPNDLENSVRRAAERIAQELADAVEIKVSTLYKTITPDAAPNLDEGTLAARTILKLDGDSETTIAMRPTETGGLEIDTALLELHQRNVSTAIEYRARILSSLLTLLQTRGRQL